MANSFFGRSKSEVIRAILFEFLESAVSISAFYKENKATSAPEIKAEHRSKTISKITLTKNEVLMSESISNKLPGSGSKIMKV